MLTVMKMIVRDTKAQDLAEYGIALGVIAVAVAAAALTISGNVEILWAQADAAIAGAV